MPQTIHDGFVANLNAKSGRTKIEDQFLTNLQRQDLTTAPELTAYVKACQNRMAEEPAAFMHDFERVLSVQRRIARRLQVVESMALFPADDLAEPDLNLKFDPETCRLP